MAAEQPARKPASAAAAAPAPPRKKPDELLCTICGLKACWMKPQDDATEQAKQPQT